MLLQVFLFYVENSYECNFNTPLLCDVWGDAEPNGILVYFIYILHKKTRYY